MEGIDKLTLLSKTLYNERILEQRKEIELLKRKIKKIEDLVGRFDYCDCEDLNNTNGCNCEYKFTCPHCLTELTMRHPDWCQVVCKNCHKMFDNPNHSGFHSSPKFECYMGLSGNTIPLLRKLREFYNEE